MSARSEQAAPEVIEPPPELASRELTGTGLDLRNVLALAKPGITTFNVLMAAAGMLLAPGEASLALVLATLVGTCLVVGGANALNSYLERDSDRLMNRTRRRPLPAGRVSPAAAFGLGIGGSAIGLALLGVFATPMCTLLAAAALVIYVMIYTPMKRLSDTALLVGSIPGAMPPLMGWTALTDSVDAGGLALFAVLFVWQIPHFLAISLYRLPDFRRAGIRTVPELRGEPFTRWNVLAWTALLVPVSLASSWLGVTGAVYTTAAAALGAGFLYYVLNGLRAGGNAWARRVFLASLAYLPLLCMALLIDAVV